MPLHDDKRRRVCQRSATSGKRGPHIKGKANQDLRNFCLFPIFYLENVNVWVALTPLLTAKYTRTYLYSYKQAPSLLQFGLISNSYNK